MSPKSSEPVHHSEALWHHLVEYSRKQGQDAPKSMPRKLFNHRQEWCRHICIRHRHVTMTCMYDHVYYSETFLETDFEPLGQTRWQLSPIIEGFWFAKEWFVLAAPPCALNIYEPSLFPLNSIFAGKRLDGLERPIEINWMHDRRARDSYHTSMYDKGVKIWEFIQFVIFFTSFLIHSDLSTPPTPAGQSPCLACNSASSCSTRCKSMATYSCCSLTFTTKKHSQWHHTPIWPYKKHNQMLWSIHYICHIYQLYIKPVSDGNPTRSTDQVDACLRLAASSCDSCSSVGPSLPPERSSWASLPLWAATLVASSSSSGISSGRGY